VHTGGTVDGEAAGDETAVIEVKTGDLPFDGGDSEFTLTVSDTTGTLPRTINVTLTITTNKTGAAVFVVSRDAVIVQRPGYYAQGGVETLERVWGAANSEGLTEALTWMRTNAVSDTEYLVRVEHDEPALPRFALTYGYANATNVILRLKGTGNAPQKTATDPGGWKLSPNDKVSSSGGAVNFNASIGRDPMNFVFFQIGDTNKSTFILGSNITIKGRGNSQYSNTRGALYVSPNSMLIMERGSAIADWYMNIDTEEQSTVYVKSLNQASRDPSTHGHLRIEGGSFVNNTVHENHYLIRVSAREGRMAVGSIYKAASTLENPIVFSGNSNNTLFIYSSNKDNPSTYYDLDNLTGSLSRPTE
jgi:hypothetical protein